jgi:hypothetical protein
MLKAITSLPLRKPVKVIKSPAWKGAITRGSGAVLKSFSVLEVITRGGALYVQGSRSLERPVTERAKRVSVVAWDAHGKSREGRDAGALVVRRHERSSIIADRKDTVGVADTDGRTVLNFDASVCVVE